MRHGAFLAALALLFGSGTALAAGAYQPVQVPRHGGAVTHLRNMQRIAVFGAPDASAAREAMERHGVRLDHVGSANDVIVLEVSRADGLTPTGEELELAADELLSVPGVSGYGPVYYGADATVVPTGRIWVYLPAGTSESAARAHVEALGLVLDEYVEVTRGIAMARPAARFSLTRAVDRLRALGQDVEPELMRRYVPRSIPSDPYFARQWYLRNTGEDIDAAYGSGVVPATAFADCRASDAWDLTIGSADVIVGVIDSGTDCAHPELEGKCVSPYNAISNLPTATPPSLAEDMMAGHGTSVAGIIAAPADAVGMVGVCPSCRVAPVRLIQSGVFLTDAMMLRAFKHVVDAGAAVINNSWGPVGSGDVFIPVSSGELEGLKYAETGRGGLGTLVVYAAGNESWDTTYQGQLKTGLTNVMAIAASNQFDLRSAFSNYGAEIDVAAPSNDTYLTPVYISLEVLGRGDLDHDYTSAFGGTSAAAPVVSGVAGLVLAANSTLTAQQVRGLLRSTADKVDPGGGQYDLQGHSPKYGYGRVNAYKAVIAATGAADPLCSPPAAQEDCSSHLDENCDGWVDEGCDSTSPIGTPCTDATQCGSAPFWLCPSTGKVHGVCTLNCAEAPCPSGASCVQGRCAPDCGDTAPCAFSSEQVCTDDLLGVCLPRCTSAADCPADEVCDPQTQLCHLDTDGLPGSTCTSDECLGNGGMCLTPGMGFPDGYCTHSCSSHSQCENNGRCIETSMGKFCYGACSFDGDCRSGYLCEQAGPRAGTCYKPCDKDSQCTGAQPIWANIVCELSSGRCVDSNAGDAGADAEPDAEADAGIDGSSDAAIEPEAAPQADAANDDAAAQPAPAAPDSADSGCGCRAAGNGQTPGALAFAALAALALAAGRSRRRHPSR